jgi:hypothetical protein
MDKVQKHNSFKTTVHYATANKYVCVRTHMRFQVESAFRNLKMNKKW